MVGGILLPWCREVRELPPVLAAQDSPGPPHDEAQTPVTARVGPYGLMDREGGIFECLHGVVVDDAEGGQRFRSAGWKKGCVGLTHSGGQFQVIRNGNNHSANHEER